MGSEFIIPGLGQLSAHDTPPAPPSDAVLSGVETVAASPDTEMTGAADASREADTQAEDKVMSGASDETVPAEGSSAKTSEPTATVQSSDRSPEAVSSKDDLQDTKIDDNHDQQNNNTLELVAATLVSEAQNTEMSGSEIQEQQTAEVVSPPGSPPVTHALEAALDGLLGPAQDQASDGTVPTNDSHDNSQEPKDPSTAIHDPITKTVTSEGEAVPVEGQPDANPEWEVDSSPYESSSSDSSDDSSDDESDVEESKLSIEETARMLMEADGGSDEEIDGARAAKQAATVRTKSEQPDEPVPKPEIIIDAQDTVLPLGIVQHIVEGTHVVIEALPSVGEASILDRGTVLCKEDRTVLGVIHDTIATVHKPMYILKSSSEDEVTKAGLERGSQIWYAKAHAVVVFPSQLKREKGSDASNLYDEEVGPEEMEYSDDEQEQAHKREKKNKKQRAKGTRGNKFSRGDDNDSRASVNGDASLKYEDDDDGPYKPLSRPANFGMGLPPPPPPPAAMSPYPPAHGNRGGHPQGRRGDSRGRGGRGRGFDGRGRGGHGHNRPLSTSQPQNNYLPPPPFAANTPPMPGTWPFPIPPMPHFGGATSSNPNTPGPSYPMPNWTGQPSPLPFTPVPPPNWPNVAQRPAQQTSYSPPTGGYNMPAVQFPPNGAAHAPVPPPPPPPNYQQQYQNYYNGQPPNGQSQQRWG
ncbi:unnamed protein product [Discula destructiva]